jgi:hypothetical protein
LGLYFNNKLISLIAFGKLSKLLENFDENKTEVENMKANNFIRYLIVEIMF